MSRGGFSPEPLVPHWRDAPVTASNWPSHSSVTSLPSPLVSRNTGETAVTSLRSWKTSYLVSSRSGVSWAPATSPSKANSASEPFDPIPRIKAVSRCT